MPCKILASLQPSQKTVARGGNYSSVPGVELHRQVRADSWFAISKESLLRREVLQEASISLDGALLDFLRRHSADNHRILIQRSIDEAC
jgi:hypothetical protein